MLGCILDKVRDELWQKDEPSLDEVISVGKRIEHSIKCVNILKKDVDKKTEVHIIQQGNVPAKGKKFVNNSKPAQRVPGKGNSSELSSR